MVYLEDNRPVAQPPAPTDEKQTMNTENGNGHYHNELSQHQQLQPSTIIERLRNAPTNLVGNIKQKLTGTPQKEPSVACEEDSHGIEITEFHLPNAVEEMASLYADELHSQALKEPLEQFLLDAGQAPDLEALAVVVWEEQDLPTILSVYALTDLSKAYREGYRSPSAAGAIRTAYQAFHKSLKANHIELRPDLSFYNTGGEDLLEIISTLPRELSTEEFMGVKMATGSMRLLSVARLSE